MNIDILAAPQFHNCRIDAPRGIHNSGGGMSVLIDSIRACLMDRYAIRLCKEFTMNRLAKQIVTHPATEHRLEIFAESIDLINQWTDPFLEADAIVGHNSIIQTRSCLCPSPVI